MSRARTILPTWPADELPSDGLAHEADVVPQLAAAGSTCETWHGAGTVQRQPGASAGSGSGISG